MSMSEEKSKVSYMVLDVTIQRMEALGALTHRKPGSLIDWLVEQEYNKTIQAAPATVEPQAVQA